MLRRNKFLISPRLSTHLGGRLRRRASRRGKTPSWRACNINLDELSRPNCEEALKKPHGRPSCNSPSAYATGCSRLMEPDCSENAGGPCVNSAFVPEIEVTEPEEPSATPGIPSTAPPDYTATSHINQELQAVDEDDEEKTETDIDRHRADFV